MKKNTFAIHTMLVMLAACLLLFVGAAEARGHHHHHHGGGNSSATGGSSGGGNAKNKVGNFDYYLLVLSWSPEFCSTPAGHQASKQQQCSGSFGFVVHGLWPENNNKSYPQSCGKAAPVPSAVADIALNANPPMPPGDPQLIDHEWAKHGTCSGLSQNDYFTAIKTSAEKVVIPDTLKAVHSAITLDANAIASEFTSANPGMTTDMLNIGVDGKGNVSEVQICLSKEFNFQNCQGKHSLKGGTFLPVN